MLNKGILYLIPVPLGDGNVTEVIPNGVREITATLNHFIVENSKTARRFIKLIHPEVVQSSLELFELDKHAEFIDAKNMLAPCLEGKNMGLMSEAGVPGVADPGAVIVKAAHENGITVKPLVGPSSILMAVMAAGMNGQQFAFNGYLPLETSARRSALMQLEQRSQKENQSQLFIETPYRNDKLVEEMLNVLHNDTLLSISCDLTTSTEFVQTHTVAHWKKQKIQLHKRPAIFTIHKL